jgi:hypothetical protein
VLPAPKSSIDNFTPIERSAVTVAVIAALSPMNVRSVTSNTSCIGDARVATSVSRTRLGSAGSESNPGGQFTETAPVSPLATQSDSALVST